MSNGQNAALASRFNQMFPVLTPAEIDRVRRLSVVEAELGFFARRGVTPAVAAHV